MAAASALGKTPAPSIQYACHNPQCDKLAAVAKRCTGCWAVRYCSKACQVAHWGAHKVVCVQKKGSDLGAKSAEGVKSNKVPQMSKEEAIEIHQQLSDIAYAIVDLEFAQKKSLFPLDLSKEKWTSLRDLIQKLNIDAIPSQITSAIATRIMEILKEKGDQLINENSVEKAVINKNIGEVICTQKITFSRFIMDARRNVLQEVEDAKHATSKK